MRYDCVVIGSGVAGMTSALVLARAGRRTLLVERSACIAPTLRGFVREGVQFDTGLHYLGGVGPGEPLDTYFRHMGLGPLPLVPYGDPAVDRLRFLDSGRELFLPAGYAALERYLGGEFLDEGEEVARYLRVVRQSFESSPFLNFDLTPGAQTMGGEALDGVALADCLDERFRSPELKAALSVYCLLYGASPREAPVSLHAKVAGSYYLSAHGLAGGGRTLVRAYESALGEAGVDILANTTAKSIEVGLDGAVRALLAEDGRRFETRACVAAVHPEALLGLAPAGAFRPAYARRIGSIPATSSAHMLFAVADAPVPELFGCNIIACPHADIASFFTPGRALSRGPFYVSSGPPLDGAPQGVVAIAPGDFEAVRAWAGTRRGRRPDDYLAYKSAAIGELQGALVDACPELAGVRGVEGATPLTLRDWMSAPRGAMYGARHSVEHFSPQPMTRVPGLVLAGQSVVAPGVLGAVVSAYLTCGLILGFSPLWEDLRSCR